MFLKYQLFYLNQTPIRPTCVASCGIWEVVWNFSVRIFSLATVDTLMSKENADQLTVQLEEADTILHSDNIQIYPYILNDSSASTIRDEVGLPPKRITKMKESTEGKISAAVNLVDAWEDLVDHLDYIEDPSDIDNPEEILEAAIHIAETLDKQDV